MASVWIFATTSTVHSPVGWAETYRPVWERADHHEFAAEELYGHVVCALPGWGALLPAAREFV